MLTLRTLRARLLSQVFFCLISTLQLTFAATQDRPQLVSQTGHTKSVKTVVFSPDGKTLASVAYDRTLRLWDVASRREIKTFSDPASLPMFAAFSPDGKTLASADNKATVRLWDINSGLAFKTFSGHTNVVASVAFSPDGSMLASGSWDKTLRLWDVTSGLELKILSGHTRGVTALAFSPDGKTLASSSEDKTLRLWDVASGLELKTFHGHTAQVYSVAFSPDGKTLVSGGFDQTLRLWAVVSGLELKTLIGHASVVSSVAFSPDGETVASGSWDKTLRLWDAASGRNLKTFSGHVSMVASVAFNPDGKSLASGSWEETLRPLEETVRVRVWSVSSGRELQPFEGRASIVNSIAFSRDGKRSASGSDDKSVRVWDLAGKRELKIFNGHTSWVTSVAFSPDGNALAAGGRDGTIRLWDIISGLEVKTFSGHRHGVLSIAFSPNGKILASGGDDNLRLWDAISGREIKTLPGHVRAESTSLAFSPDGQTLVSGGKDNAVRLWEVASGRELKTLVGHNWFVQSVAFNPDGKTFASASSDGSVRLWDIASGREVRIFGRDKGWVESEAFDRDWVMSVAFSPDGKILASGTGNGTLRLWDVASGHALRILRGHKGSVNSVVFSPDGALIASASADARNKFWRVSDGTELATLVSFTDGAWAVSDSGGRYDSSQNGENPNLHWVVGLTPIGIEQLKERYYDPGLLAKIMGFNKEALRTVPPFEAAAVKLPPVVALSAVAPGAALARITDEGGGVGRVRVRLNGKELAADASAQLRPAAGDKPGGNARELRINLPTDRLLPGANTLDVIAFNADNHIQSRLVSLTVNGPEPTGRGGPAQPAATPPGPPPTLFVIAAGVSQYAAPDKRLNLQFAGKDAADLTQALLLGGQRLFGVGRVRAHLLTDADTDVLKAQMATQLAAQPTPPTEVNTLNTGSPSRAGIEAAFTAVAKEAKPGDIVVVSMAGHGVMTAGSGLDTGDYHFLTREAQSTDLSDPAVRKLWGISSAELTEWTKAIKANKQVLVLDTCAAGGAVEKLVAQRSLPGSHTIALERLKDRTGFHILAGSAADQVSYEASRYGQGLLTYALLSGLRGAALRDGEFVDISTLFQYAVDEVPKLAKGVGGIQRPMVSSPRGSSFDIGRLTADDKKRVPLAQIKPLILRAQIQSDDFRDSLRLEARLNAYLREQNQSIARGALIFVDADEHPDGWKLRARYRQQGDKYLLEGALFQGEQEKGRVKVELKADEAGQVGDLMAVVRKGVGE